MTNLGLALENQIVLHKVLQELLDEGFYDFRRVNWFWYETSLLLKVSLSITRPENLGEYLLRFPNAISVSCRGPIKPENEARSISVVHHSTSNLGLEVLASFHQLRYLELDCVSTELEETFQLCLERLTNLESLKLMKLWTKMATKIFPVLEDLPLLRSLTWNCIGNQLIQCQPLKGVCQLESLKITQNCLFNQSWKLMLPSLTHLTSLEIDGQEIVKSGSGNKSLLKKLMPYSESLRSLSLNCSSKISPFVLYEDKHISQFIELRSLKLKNVKSPSDDCGLFEHIASLPNLTSLHLEDVTIWTQYIYFSASSFSKLRSLSMGNIVNRSGSKFDLNTFVSVSVPGMQLKKLSILEEIRLPSNCVCFSYLTELSLRFVSVDPNVLHNALKRLRKVKCLSLKCSMYVSSKSLKRLKGLHAFTLKCSSVDQDLVQTLGCVPSLTNLRLEKCSNFHDSSLKELSFVSQLTSLTLYNLLSLTSVGYKKLGDGKLMKLRYLGLHQHGLVQNELMELKAKLPSLRTLHTLQ